MDTNFCIRIELRSAMVVGRYPTTADGLLAGIEYERTGDFERPLPFASWHNIPMASQMIPGHMGKPAEYERVTYYTQPARDLQFDLHLMTFLDRDPTITELTDAKRGRGPLASFGNTYSTAMVQEVFFACRGDIDHAREILTASDGTPLVPSMGPQHNKGHGRIQKIDLIPMPNENRLFGIIGHAPDGPVVLRPIPTRLARELPPAKGILMERTWRNPYKDTFPEAEVATCITPPFQRGAGFRLADLRQFARAG